MSERCNRWSSLCWGPCPNREADSNGSSAIQPVQYPIIVEGSVGICTLSARDQVGCGYVPALAWYNYFPPSLRNGVPVALWGRFFTQSNKSLKFLMSQGM